MVTQMLAVGEETGNVDVLLEKVADFYDHEVEATVLGGAVGGMVVALYMPMSQIINLVE